MLEDRDYMKAESRRPKGWSLPKLRTAVLPLVIFTGFIYILQLLTKDFASLGYGLPSLTSFPVKGAPAGALGRWVFGVFAYMFIHGPSPLHALGNMVVLFFLGRRLEKVMKPRRFLFFYLSAGVLAGGFWVATHWNDTFTTVVGASGAVFAVILAALMLAPEMKVLLFWVFPVRLKWVVAGIALLALVNFLGSLGSTDQGGVSHWTHLGGIIAGYLLLQIFFRRQIAMDISSLWRPRPRRRRRAGAGRSAPSWPATDRTPKKQGDEDAVDPLTQIDPILDKIGKQGMKSLTREERRILDQARERLNRDS